MAKEPFAGGRYDFSKLALEEGVIVEFKKKKGGKQFFIRRDDGSETLVWTSFELETRVGHRIRFIEHADIGWLGCRIFETQTYHISKAQIRRTVKSGDLPAYGRLYRYLFPAFWLSVAGISIGLDPEGVGLINLWSQPNPFVSIVGVLIIALSAYLMVRLIHSLWIKSKVRDDFLDVLYAEIKDALYR